MAAEGGLGDGVERDRVALGARDFGRGGRVPAEAQHRLLAGSRAKGADPDRVIARRRVLDLHGRIEIGRVVVAVSVVVRCDHHQRGVDIGRAADHQQLLRIGDRQDEVRAGGHDRADAAGHQCVGGNIALQGNRDRGDAGLGHHHAPESRLGREVQRRLLRLWRQQRRIDLKPGEVGHVARPELDFRDQHRAGDRRPRLGGERPEQVFARHDPLEPGMDDAELVGHLAAVDTVRPCGQETGHAIADQIEMQPRIGFAELGDQRRCQIGMAGAAAHPGLGQIAPGCVEPERDGVGLEAAGELNGFERGRRRRTKQDHDGAQADGQAEHPWHIRSPIRPIPGYSSGCLTWLAGMD